MKTFRIFLLAGSAILASCASTPESRIEKNPAAYAALSSSQKDLVVQGKIVEGMPKNGVYLAWGSPSAIYEGGSGGKSVERWRYNGYQPVYSNTICVGYGPGYGYPGRYAPYAPTVNYIPYTRAEVQFSNDRVSKWQRLR